MSNFVEAEPAYHGSAAADDVQHEQHEIPIATFVASYEPQPVPTPDDPFSYSQHGAALETSPCLPDEAVVDERFVVANAARRGRILAEDEITSVVRENQGARAREWFERQRIAQANELARRRDAEGLQLRQHEARIQAQMMQQEEEYQAANLAIKSEAQTKLKAPSGYEVNEYKPSDDYDVSNYDVAEYKSVYD